MPDHPLLRLHPGKFINKICVEDVAAVKVGRAILGTQVRVLLWCGKVVAGIGQIMRPGVVQIDLRAAMETLLQAAPPRVATPFTNSGLVLGLGAAPAGLSNVVLLMLTLPTKGGLMNGLFSRNPIAGAS